VVCEADDAEEDREDGETHELDGLAANRVDQGYRHPVTRDCTGADDDQVTDGLIVEDVVHVAAASVADSGEDDGVVESETVESNIEEEPRASGSKENLAMPPLAVMMDEIAPTSFRDIEVLGRVLDGLDPADLVRVTLCFALHVGLGVLAGLLDIASDIESVARGFRDGQTVVQRNAAWHSTEADDHTPHLVDRKTADTTTVRGVAGGLKRLLEASSNDESNDGGAELSDTLHGKHRAHHGTPPFGGSESVDCQWFLHMCGGQGRILGGDDG